MISYMFSFGITNNAFFIYFCLPISSRRVLVFMISRCHLTPIAFLIVCDWTWIYLHYLSVCRYPQSDLISRQSFGDLFSRFGDLLSHFGGLLSRLGDFNNSLWWHIYSLWIFINPLWRLINSLWRLINPLWWLINSLWRLLDICPFSASVLQYEPIWNEIMARDNQYWCYNHRPPEWHFSGAYFTNIWFNFTPTVNK